MKKNDTLTLLAVGAICWILRVVTHEVIGHGGSNLFFGGKAISVSTMFFKASQPDFSFLQQKVFIASGSIINLILGFTSFYFFKKQKTKNSWKGYFLWITSIIFILNTGGYIAFSQFLSSGMDWSVFLKGLSPLWLWKTLELIVGVSLIYVGFKIAVNYKRVFFFKGITNRYEKKILVLPYISATLVSVIAALNMVSDNLGLLVLGAFGNSFFFLSPMLIAAFIKVPTTLNKEIADKPTLTRNYWLISIASFLTLLFILVLSREIYF
ncbi:hypothetical protein [Flagellimonas allohymeniacidonis]|uniref:Uncharacterized protein n=1 Tax=Flagellimonas allohymeniacidonis TaxID=2517819 RepID=A0A4V2HSS5_9FLAO|nr:hypothetical protein [Allomuricauda hymeniacidonis]TAI48890.1 hypothetical protein EW142_03575 [Allomuricauda hymeniacidonis]